MANKTSPGPYQTSTHVGTPLSSHPPSHLCPENVYPPKTKTRIEDLRGENNYMVSPILSQRGSQTTFGKRRVLLVGDSRGQEQ